MGQTVLLIFGIVLAGFFVSLALRLFKRRERWAKVLATAAVVLVAYPLSVGPACWTSSHLRCGAGVVSQVYQPLFSIWWNGPKPANRLVAVYATAFAAQDWTIGSGGCLGSGGYHWGEFRPAFRPQREAGTAQAE